MSKAIRKKNHSEALNYPTTYATPVVDEWESETEKGVYVGFEFLGRGTAHWRYYFGSERGPWRSAKLDANDDLNSAMEFHARMTPWRSGNTREAIPLDLSQTPKE